MTAELVALSVLAMAPAGTVLGEVPGEDPPLPWRSLTVRMPTTHTESDAGTGVADLVRVTATLSAASDQGVLRIADEMLVALAGRRPVVEGWTCGPLRHVGSSDPYLAQPTETQSNRRVTVCHVSFAFTAVRH